MNLPDYHFLPAPLWLITILHILTLTLHFAAMNFMFGGIVVILFCKLQNKWQHPVVLQFVKLFPVAMAATVTLGVAPLLFVQLVYPQQIYSASIISGWFWLLIFVVAIISYYFLYAGSFSKTGGSKLGIYLATALVGLLYISFVYSSVFSMAEHPKLMSTLYAGNQSGFVINSHVGSYIFRWLHMLLGAITVGGFFVGLLGRHDDKIFSIGKRFFLWGMIITMVIGIVYMFTFGEYLRAYMRSPAIWWLLVAFILSLASLHFFFRQRFVIAGSMLFISLLGMVINRHIVRLLFLQEHYDPTTIPVHPQWSVFFVFLVCFLLALGAVWYMLKLYFNDKQIPAPE